MTRRRFLDHDTFGDTTEIFHPRDDGKWAIQTYQDVEPVLEANKIAQTDGTDGWSKSRELKRVASIPNNVILMWIERYGVDIHKKDHWPAVKKLLNDPEWRHLRTSGGRV